MLREVDIGSLNEHLDLALKLMSAVLYESSAFVTRPLFLIDFSRAAAYLKRSLDKPGKNLTSADHGLLLVGSDRAKRVNRRTSRGLKRLVT